MCLVIVVSLVEEDFFLVVKPIIVENPETGDEYKVRCEVVGPLAVGRPSWYDQEGQEIHPLGQGNNDQLLVVGLLL